MVPQNSRLQTFFRISSLVFRANTFIQVWKYLRLSKWWQKFHFWMNYPFKCYQWFAPLMNGIVNQGSKIIGIKQTGLSYSFDQFVLQKVLLLLLQIVLIHCSMNLKCFPLVYVTVRLNLKETGIYILVFPLLEGFYIVLGCQYVVFAACFVYVCCMISQQT